MLEASPQTQALWSSLGRYSSYLNEQLLKPLQDRQSLKRHLCFIGCVPIITGNGKAEL